MLTVIVYGKEIKNPIDSCDHALTSSKTKYSSTELSIAKDNSKPATHWIEESGYNGRVLVDKGK